MDLTRSVRYNSVGASGRSGVSGVTYVTFKCGACGKFNAVGDDLRGQKVRCPHCQQVVQVPGGDSAVELPPAGELDDGVSFTVRPAETDSILVSTEGVGDVLFDEPDDAPVLEMPDMEAPETEAPPVMEPSIQVTETGGPDVPEGTTAFAFAPPVVESTAVAGVEPPRGESAAVAGAASAPSAEATSLAGADHQENPWANESLSRTNLAEAEPPAIEGVIRTPDAAEFAGIPARESTGTLASSATRPVPAKPSASSWLLVILVPYAMAATVAAVFLFIRGRADYVHPLDSLRDQGLYETFAEGRQERVDPTQVREADKDPILLGQSRRVGDLEVTPLRVTREPLRYDFFRGAHGFEKGEESLVLHLRLKNASEKLAFHPNDATFNRMHAPDALSYTFVEIDGRPYYGPVPVEESYSERLKGQNFEELLPGQSMETIIVATEPAAGSRGAGPRTALEALKAVKPDQQLVWRVHLRKGREKVRTQRGSREVWVTTVVPIGFTPAQVQPGG